MSSSASENPALAQAAAPQLGTGAEEATCSQNASIVVDQMLMSMPSRCESLRQHSDGRTTAKVWKVFSGSAFCTWQESETSAISHDADFQGIEAENTIRQKVRR
jgi:hypothetical protein